MPVLSEKIILFSKINGEDVIFKTENLFFPIFFLEIYCLYLTNKYYQGNFDDLSRAFSTINFFFGFDILIFLVKDTSLE